MDLLFVNGPGPDVAVAGGRITAVGDVPERTSRTEVIDLAGRALLPGFVDAHVHAVVAGVEAAQVDLTEATSADECRALVAAYARAHPEREWITGAGWSLELFDGGLPTAALLDDVVPDRPVHLANRDHHGAWVNSRALALAGIDATTPDPPDGRIERAADGSPTGMLQEGAMGLVGRLVPPLTGADRLAGLVAAQRRLHGHGVTGWQDALLGESPLMPDVTGAYLDAIGAGLLTAKVTGALWWDRHRGAEQIEELVARRARHRALGFDTGTVKIMQDGIVENLTAGMVEPYCCGPGTGLSFVDPDLLGGHVTELDRLGFQVHFHALGDRAVREALDAVEAARRANGPSGNRHHLAHLQVVAPADVPRFAALGAVATVQPLWAAHEPQMDELTIPRLGPDRASLQYPFAALLASGAVLAAGSDWPVTSPDPWEAIHVAVNRRALGDTGPVFLPGQRIDLAAAVAAYTAGSAYVNRRDDTGALRVGGAADLVVLDRDPFALPVEEIGRTGVDMTFVDGRCVHDTGR